jgi:hypothetical protein
MVLVPSPAGHAFENVLKNTNATQPQANLRFFYFNPKLL